MQENVREAIVGGRPLAILEEKADPYRVEIKQNAKGEPAVSVRATHQDQDEAVRIALEMYQRTLQSLGGSLG